MGRVMIVSADFGDGMIAAWLGMLVGRLPVCGCC